MIWLSFGSPGKQTKRNKLRPTTKATMKVEELQMARFHPESFGVYEISPMNSLSFGLFSAVYVYVPVAWMVCELSYLFE